MHPAQASLGKHPQATMSMAFGQTGSVRARWPGDASPGYGEYGRRPKGVRCALGVLGKHPQATMNMAFGQKGFGARSVSF
jgi:hypothetical protein